MSAVLWTGSDALATFRDIKTPWRLPRRAVPYGTHIVTKGKLAELLDEALRSYWRRVIRVLKRSRPRGLEKHPTLEYVE